ncbi:MAG: VanW family protein [Candidatus Peregrinibacteria bacterium]|nr:VanW family protein [Candidatus Peregrinibacteria bacterium]MDZ4244646.1 VanW family protein [Candidatus Gracilibacteria bacterium]
MLTRILKTISIAAILAVLTFGGSIGLRIAFAEDAVSDAANIIGPFEFFDIPVTFVIGEEPIDIPLMSFLKRNADGNLVYPKENEDFELELKKIYSIAGFINRYAIDAKVYLDDHDKLAISEEKVGTRIDMTKLETDVRSAITNYDISAITVEYELVPPRTAKADLEIYLPSLNDIIAQKIILKTLSGEAGNAISEKYTFDMKSHFDALDMNFTTYLDFRGKRIPVSMITEDPLAGTVLKTDWVLGLNMQKIDDYIKENLASELEVPTENVTINMEMPENKDDENWIYNAKITFDGSAQNGIVVDREALIGDMLRALNSDDKSVKIRLKEVKAEVFAPQELKDRGITELFSVGYSNFSGSSWKRVHNIKTGIDRFNGVIMPKDEVFSFNTRLGPVDGGAGYLEELVIKGDKTEPDFGGGLCQVSSTFFRAGLFGGLDIAERKAHSYAVSYYARPGGHGLDCTIYPGVADCKILNDSPGDLLIQAYIDGNDAYFKFYGTQDGRTVGLDGPYYSNQAGAPPDKIIYDPNLPEDYYEEKEHPHNGFDAVWYRTVVNSLGEEIKQTFISRYQARPKVILRGGTKPTEESE